MRKDENGERVNDYGDDYGLRLKLVTPSTVVVAVVVHRYGPKAKTGNQNEKVQT